MSTSTVITLGYGSFGAVKFLPALGYGTAGTPVPVVTRDKHDGYVDIEDTTPKRIAEERERREQLRAQIVEAYEEITGGRIVPSPSQISRVEKRKPEERIVLAKIRTEVDELEEIDRHLVMLSKKLQQEEMDDIAFIVSIL